MQPLIIGAALSGSNMVRDVLPQFPGVGTWACDGINYTWRHGNPLYPTHEFPPGFPRSEVGSCIQSCFNNTKNIPLMLWLKKACANPLRHIVKPARNFAGTESVIRQKVF
jgi:hypothetical protein